MPDRGAAKGRRVMNDLTEESRPTLARGVRLRTDPINGEPLLLFPEGFLSLDQAAHDILIRCTGKLTMGEIVGALSEEYDADAAALRTDVAEYVTQLRREMLLTC